MKIITWLKKKVNKVVAAVSAVSTMAVITIMSFAADTTGEYVVATAEDLAPILDGAKANTSVVFPVAVGIMTIMIGIGVIPVVIRKFKNGN